MTTTAAYPIAGTLRTAGPDVRSFTGAGAVFAIDREGYARQVQDDFVDPSWPASERVLALEPSGELRLAH